MRGKGAVKIKAQPQAGITPACAGKSTKQEKHRDKAKDHPRVCGEKPCRCRYPVQPSGSPPRVRGKVQRRPAGIRPPGITPACAGKRGCDHQRQNRARDHPRVCGEKRRIVVHSAQSVGSPPRVRGKDSLFLLCPVSRGITPACAGKRLKRSHSIGHFSCILCLFHSVLHRASVSGGSRAGPCAPPCLPAQNAVPV